MFIASLMPSSHLILWCPLLLLLSIFPSIRDFSNESSVCIRWLKYWSLSLSSIQYPMNIQGRSPLKLVWSPCFPRDFQCLLQHYSLKASILWHSAFFMVQLSQLYMTTGKTIALTIWTFVSRVMSLLFNTLSRFVIAFLPRSSHLLISQLQSPSAEILEPKKRNFVTTSTFSPSICHTVMGPDAMILVPLILSLKLALSLSSFILIKRLYFLFTFCHPLEWYHPHIWGRWCFSRLSWFQLVTHSVWHFSWCA